MSYDLITPDGTDYDGGQTYDEAVTRRIVLKLPDDTKIVPVPQDGEQ